MKNVVIYVVVILVVLAAGVFLLYKPQAGSDDHRLDNFAQCLADKKLVMYGAYWCPHCQAQKKLFGASVEKMPYVECTTNVKECTDKAINGYPTWIDANGNRYEGEQTLEKLSQISRCSLP